MRYLFVILFSISVYSQTIQLTIDTNKLRIGEQFNLKVILNNIDPDSIITHEFDSLFNDLKQVKFFKNEEFNLIEDSIWKEYVFTSFDTGNFVIPNSYIIMNKDTLLTNDLSVSFLSVPLDTTNRFFDIKSPKNIPFKISELFFSIKYLVLIVFILCVIYFLYRYLKPQKTDHKQIIQVHTPIDVYYLNKLKALEQKKYVQNKDFKIYFSELSEIFRGYLESRFDIPALESATYDLKKMLHELEISEDWFTDFFRSSDLVKFAKGQPSEESSLLFIRFVKEFITKHRIKLLNKNSISDHDSNLNYNQEKIK